MDNVSVSFVIPTYENISLLERCIVTLFYNAISGFDGRYEVIIVDDGSSPHIQEAVRNLAMRYHCELSLKPKNESYTRTINTGLQYAQGTFCVLVNNDIEFSQKGWLLKMLSPFHHDPQVGIAGCRLIYPTGRIQHGGMIFAPLTAKSNFIHLHVGQPRNHLAAMINKPMIAVTGALMMLRRQMMNEIGLFDESFRLVCSDTDMCLRAHIHDWKVIYCGRAEAIHVEGGTRGNTPKNKNPILATIEDSDIKIFNNRWMSKMPMVINQLAGSR